MDLIRCPRCVKEIPDESRYCRRCGCAVGRDAGLWARQGPWSYGAGYFDDGKAPARRARAMTAAAAAEARPRSRSRVVAADSPRSGGATWQIWVVLGIAGSAFFSHVHRVATSPMTMPPAAQRSDERPHPNGPTYFRLHGRGVAETPAPPGIVRPEARQASERRSALRRYDRESDFEGRQGGAPNED